MATLQRVTPVLWFDSEAEAAAKHYCSAFKDGRITRIERYGKAGPGTEGSVMLVEFEIAGIRLAGLNGGPLFTPNEAVSLMITCEDQAEVDRLWEHFSHDGSKSVCGWVKDRWGFAWQIAPKRFFELMDDPDPEHKNRVFAAMLKMTKLDIAGLEAAARG